MGNIKIKKVSDEKPQWELMYESEHPDVDKLIRVYKEDPYKARVLFCQNKTKYFYYRFVKFTRSTGTDLVSFKVSYGISKTQRIYSRQSKYSSIICKDDKVWIQFRPSPRMPLQLLQMTFNGLYFMGHTNGLAKDFLRKKYFWFKTIEEHTDMHDMSFNTIMKYKLFGYNDMLRHRFKCPLPIIKIIKPDEKDRGTDSLKNFLKVWKEMKQVLIHIDRLSPELYHNPLFSDTCKMAAALTRKVNCTWGAARLKEEHDKWSREITKIVLDCEPLYDLKILKEFKKFAEYSGYKLLTTNKSMMEEGMVQDHCVATYIKRVDHGECAIFHVKDYTLQIIIKTYIPKELQTQYNSPRILGYSQFQGYKNNSAPHELRHEVEGMIHKFNLEHANELWGPKISPITPPTNSKVYVNTYIDAVIEGGDLETF